MIINGNSLDELKKLPENSIDSVVTDPPYGLSFMGKKWDYDVPSKDLWVEVFRVLKPGGHLLAFAGTRTQHRMAVNIEDAGFEIRDMIAWVYGSGFPKSLNIGKAVDKIQGNEREIIGYAQSNPDLRDVGRLSKEAVGIDKLSFGQAQGAKRQQTPIDKGNSPYEGWGTALKPALEPITVARKPIKGSVANNVLEWGTGGINIDGCRVEAKQGDKFGGGGLNSPVNGFMGNTENTYKKGTGFRDDTQLGRFPANFIHDGSQEVLELFPETKGSIETGSKAKSIFGSGGSTRVVGNVTHDSGSAARFFYCAKASKNERNKGLERFEVRTVNDGRDTPIDNAFQRGETPRANVHPTVKPIKLMQYLVRLVTPKGGTVLDPFNGSGTTGIACKSEGFNYIGIELDPEYCKISEARIDAW